MLGRYQGLVVLRDTESEPAEPVVPGNYYPRKLYPYRRNKYGELVSDHRVTLEQELAEIRARQLARREYNRVLRAARRALHLRNQNVPADHRALDEPDA